jgi:tetratricopeptide (TPR) repeat protein
MTPGRRWPAALIALALVALTLAVYAPVRSYGFVNFDDAQYVSRNPEVLRGLTWSGVRWALTATHAGNWHPLTWLSHMLDVQAFGLDAGAFHLTSLALHALNGLLLFWLLRRTTGSLWRSATVAALFAVHPLHVESVAWIAERKDVLSTAFFMLTLLAYVAWVRDRRPARYVLVCALFALGLMAKPMLVTLPFVLLLLDVWPLGRVRRGGVPFFARGSPDGARTPGQGTRLTSAGARPGLPGGKDGSPAPGAASRTVSVGRLVLEKIPFFALAAASAAITYTAQRAAGAVASVDEAPLTERIGNALITCIAYLWKAVWPSGLAVFYPLPTAVPLWKSAAAALVLLAATAGTVLVVKRRPWAAVGWLWYLGMLVPVLGFVQVGLQAMADRYTYLPLIGVFIVVVWGVADLAAGRRRVAAALAVLVPAVSVALAAATFRQAAVWKDSETLLARVLETAGDNYLAHYHLANVLAGQGRMDEAITHYERTLALRPGAAAAHNNLGTALMARGEMDEARRHCEEALRLKPDYAEAHNNLGSVLARSGRREEGIRQYEEALRLKPDYPEARNNLGVSLGVLGRRDEAAAQFEKALGERPDFVDALVNFGFLRQMQGRSAEALAHFDRALTIDPESASALYASAPALQSLGRTAEAAHRARRALELARAQGQDALARDIEKHLGLFGPGNGTSR